MGTSCARHPGAPSVGPCSRCGTFLCTTCAVDVDPPTCADCSLKRYEANALVDQRARLSRLLGLGVLLWLGALALMAVQLSQGVLINYLLAGALAGAIFGTVLIAGAITQRLRLPPPAEPLPHETGRLARHPALTSASLKAELAKGSPFSVCVACRIIFPALVVTRCLVCSSSADCVEVANEQDAQLVLATLS